MVPHSSNYDVNNTNTSYFRAKKMKKIKKVKDVVK